MPFWKRNKKDQDQNKLTNQHDHEHHHKESKMTSTQRPTNAQVNQASSTRAQWPGLAKVKNLIAVGSGKGGVGKSTVSLNIAYALKHLGYKVGLLDADIYGPTQSSMLGHDAKTLPKMDGNQLLPMEKFGLKYMSMGAVAGSDAPVVWRAPMATKMLAQFLNVAWGELDYLIIDMPPGTGDVQITLAQQSALSGAIIVTTPQEVALQIAKKGLKMFEQVNVPILGIVENMSGFTCSHCHEVTAVFKKGGGEKLAKDLHVPFLGSLPLDPEIMSSGEDGRPILELGPSSHAGEFILGLTKNLINSLEQIVTKGDATQPLSISIEEEQLAIDWPDGDKRYYSPYQLRISCSCASCVDENTGAKILDAKKVPIDITIHTVRAVGRYGISIQFSDGHGTGIYKFENIKYMPALSKEEVESLLKRKQTKEAKEHAISLFPKSHDAEKEKVAPANNDLFKAVEQVLKEQISPSLAQHGGNVSLVKIEDNFVYLSFGGGCQGCSQVSVTVKDGVERLLKAKFSEIQGIRDITDHLQGTNPYFK